MTTIRYRKFDPYTDESAARSFGGHFLRRIPGCVYHDQPNYLVEIVWPGGGAPTPTPVARIEREKMSGVGSCNMWGSPYRWVLSLNAMTERETRIIGEGAIFRHYFDSLRECKDFIGQRLAKMAFGVDA